MLRNAARYGLVSVVAMSGLVIALRMLFGPFDGPVRVRIPLNPEGWFGLALTALLAIRGGPIAARQPRQRRNGWWNAAVILALIAFTTAAFWRTLPLYFLSDDFILVKIAGTFDFALRPLFAMAGGDGSFRPIGYISLVLTSMCAGVNPVAWHAAALALHVANVWLVFVVATRLSASRLAASFTAGLFAIHGTRPEAAVWIAWRFDLVATFFVLAGLLFFIRSHREASSIGYLYQMASLACMVLAILSKESAYIFPLLLVLFLLAKRDLSRSRIGVLIPFFVTAAALFAYRWWLFGGIGGYKDVQTGEWQALTFGPSTVKALALRLWTALYFPINWSMEPGPWLAALMIAYMGALVWLATTRPNRKLMAFTLGFIIVSALPPLHMLVIGAELGNSRLLYLPCVGFCLMLGVAVDGLRGRIRWVIPGVILAFNFAALHHNLNGWEYASQKAKAACAIAVQCARPCNVSPAKTVEVSGLPRTLRGVPFFANGFAECIQTVGGVPLPVEFTDKPYSSVARTSCVLMWNQADDELQCTTFLGALVSN
jgi:hypothetical protein